MLDTSTFVKFSIMWPKDQQMVKVDNGKFQLTGLCGLNLNFISVDMYHNNYDMDIVFTAVHYNCSLLLEMEVVRVQTWCLNMNE